MEMQGEASATELDQVSFTNCPKCGGEGECELDYWDRIVRCESCKVCWSIGADPFMHHSSYGDEEMVSRVLASAEYAKVDLFADRQDALNELNLCEAQYRKAHLAAATAKATYSDTRDAVSTKWAAARSYLAVQGHYVEQRPAWMLDDRDCMVW